MKKFAIVALMGVVISCKTEISPIVPVPERIATTRKLVLTGIKYSPQGDVPIVTGAAMDHDGIILFNSDSTFTKIVTLRSTNEISTGTGKFSTVTYPGDNYEYLVLKYSTADNGAIESCNDGDKVEDLILTEQGARGTWPACDGPALIYEWTTTSSL